MTSAEPFLRIASFRGAVEGLAAVTPEAAASLRARLGRTVVSDAGTDGAPIPPDQERAFHILYDAAVDDGLEAVMEDLRRLVTGLDEDGRSRIQALVTPDAEANDRIEAARQRDAFLPVLRSLRTALDLRLVTVAAGDRLLPVVTMRLTFDESTNAGADSVVFQVPIPLLRALQGELGELLEDLPKLQERVAVTTVPQWAIDE